MSKKLGTLSTSLIREEVRSRNVECAPRTESGPIFNFYPGKDTPESKDYIMDKMVVPVEE